MQMESSEQVSPEWISLLLTWTCVCIQVYKHTHTHTFRKDISLACLLTTWASTLCQASPAMTWKNTHQRKNTPGKVARKRKRLLETAWYSPCWNSSQTPVRKSLLSGCSAALQTQTCLCRSQISGERGFPGLTLLPAGIHQWPGLPTLSNQRQYKSWWLQRECVYTYTNTHTHTLIHTYIPFPVHCVRPSRGGSCWAVPVREDPSSVLLGSPSQPAGDLISSSDSAWLQMKPPPSRSSFLWLTLGSFYRRISSSRKRLTQSSLQPFQLLKAATHLLPLPRRLAAPPSPRNSAATATQVQGHLSSRFHICPGIPRRPADPSTSCLLCLDWKDLGSSSLAREILVPSSSPARIGCESVSLARLLEWGGPSVASSGLYPPGEIDL